MICIQQWKQNDIPAIVAIEEEVHVAPWNNDAFLMCLQAGYVGYIAINKQSDLLQPTEIVGFIILSILDEECHILNIGVARKHQRLGIGKMLLNHSLIDAANQYHAKMVYLEVRRSNIRAIHLYQQFG